MPDPRLHERAAPRSPFGRAATRALAVLAGGGLLLEIALQLPPAREAIRSRAERALAAHWPGATIARCAAADVTGVVRFDGVRLPAGDGASVVLEGLEISIRLGALLRGRLEPGRVGAADTFVEATLPGLGKVGIGAGEGATLSLSVVDLPREGAPARVRLQGPARACLRSGGCLTAETLLEAEASRAGTGQLLVRYQALADAVRIRARDPAEPPLPLPPIAAHGEASAAPDGKRIAAGGEISVGPHGSIHATVAVAQERFEVRVTCETASYASLLDSLPLGLDPGARLGVDGPLSATARIAGSLADPPSWELDARLELAKLRAHAKRQDAGLALRQPFLYRPKADPEPPEIWMGSGNPDFLPLEETPDVVLRAVLLSEDSFFFTHSGFDIPSIVEAIKTNLKEKRVRRGGSTISQQLVKNLWLTRERTLLRKVQEALLTIALEASVPKERILEIYLNGIEWGPRIYGVRAAARHYFDKDPRELTPKEAAYLATVIPNPRKYYVHFRNGALSPAWEQRVMFLVGKMAGAGAIDLGQYEEAEWTPLRFASSGDDPWTEEVESAVAAPIED